MKKRTLSCSRSESKIKNGTKHANYLSSESDDVILSKTVNFHTIDILMPIIPILQLLF